MFSFSKLPRELRDCIYDLCIPVRETRLNLLTLNREFYKETIRYIYKDRDLVFRTHPDVLVNASPEDFRGTQPQFVTMALEHVKLPPIELPPLPWRVPYGLKNCCPLPGRVVEYHCRIIMHIYEAPKDDMLRTLVSWWCVNGIKRFLSTFEGSIRRKLRLHIVAHPLLDFVSTFATHNFLMNVDWDEDDPFSRNTPLPRTCGDLSLILSSMWSDWSADLYLHTTRQIARRLSRHSFFHSLLGHPTDAYVPRIKHVHDQSPLLEEGSVVYFKGHQHHGKWKPFIRQELTFMEYMHNYSVQSDFRGPSFYYEGSTGDTFKFLAEAPRFYRNHLEAWYPFAARRWSVEELRDMHIMFGKSWPPELEVDRRRKYQRSFVHDCDLHDCFSSRRIVPASYEPYKTF